MEASASLISVRMTPAQMAVRLGCGVRLPPFRPTEDDSLVRRVQEGHALLVKITGRDFGYDLQAWHDHLKESRQGGYTYGRNISLPRLMKDALESAEWQEAVRSLSDFDRP